ncbi:MAG: hypothetical protein IT531_17910 [Burkholderiales bacterium]|nr:hypothetical protein [Burkholderiales bacterium]
MRLRNPVSRLSTACACGAMIAFACWASAQELVRGNYYWYAPEHEKYSRTAFYTQPRFDTAQVRIPRTQRFRIGAGWRGWVELEFDVAGKAYIHLRLLHNLLHDPAAADPWYEFERASVFAEEPAKIEARLKAAAIPQVTDSKVPAWKRYKEGWNVQKGRMPSSASVLESTEGAPAESPPRPAEKKPRGKYPLLPPLGSEPAREGLDPADSSSAQPTPLQ